ncbi:MAG: hypothetical protein WBL40_18335 [Terrimicrobiaceae bacterium]
MAEEETETEGSEHDADTVGAGDPLFVPRLDLLLGARGLSDGGTEKDLYSWAVETICGAAATFALASAPLTEARRAPATSLADLVPPSRLAE